MQGMSRAEVDKAESKDFALGGKPMRPRDAATLILLDRADGAPKVLMGKRHMKHAFMPGKFVFPGGRTDPADSRIEIAKPLPAAETSRLIGGVGRTSATRARAIALSAIRETYEEAGLLIGERGDFSTASQGWLGFADAGVRPSLAGLRYIARAITPPGRVRRFDTRFLSAWRDSVAVALPDGGPTNELEEQVWLTIDDAMALDVPAITRTILGELKARLEADPELKPGGPVPFYRMLRGSFERSVL